MDNIETLQKIGLIFGPIQLFAYIWMVKSVLYSAKLAEDTTARKRWIEAIVINGGLVGSLIILMVFGFDLAHTSKLGLRFFEMIYVIFRDLSFLLCILMPAAFIGTLLTFSRIAPWFWKYGIFFTSRQDPKDK